ncbi:MAG: hypothetical protein IJ498_09190, partial [Akkermansia sp.]|nr:hypothetical protein [Akkermansia sp.]
RYFKNTTQGMVGDFSSMLNLFLLFTNIFLRFRFLRPWGIPQLLQKSQIVFLYGMAKEKTCILR